MSRFGIETKAPHRVARRDDNHKFAINWFRLPIGLCSERNPFPPRLWPDHSNIRRTEYAVGIRQALSAADRVRDRFGEQSITLATGLRGGFRERTHENPASLPGQHKKNS